MRPLPDHLPILDRPRARRVSALVYAEREIIEPIDLSGGLILRRLPHLADDLYVSGCDLRPRCSKADGRSLLAMSTPEVCETRQS